MSADARTEKAAAAIYDARTSRRPIAPISETYGIVDPRVAYTVQDVNTTRWLAEGRRLVGRKIGLTSEVVQKQLGVREPDYGMLWADAAYDNGAVVPSVRFIQPRVEAEVAFVMGGRIDSPDFTLHDLTAAVRFARAAVEIVDSAIADWKITLADTIADNASGGGFVLGDTRALDEVDVRLCGMVLSRNGAPASLGVGAACLGIRSTPPSGSHGRWPRWVAPWRRETSSCRARSVRWSTCFRAIRSTWRSRASRRSISASRRRCAREGEGRAHRLREHRDRSA